MSEKNAHKFLLRMRQLGDRLERVENICVPGMPDVNGCFSGLEFWIETKQPDEPKRPETPLFGSNHCLEQNQRNWILNQRNAGGIAVIFIQTDSWRIFVGGEWADKLNSMTMASIIQSSFYSERKNTANAASARAALVSYCTTQRAISCLRAIHENGAA